MLVAVAIQHDSLRTRGVPAKLWSPDDIDADFAGLPAAEAEQGLQELVGAKQMRLTQWLKGCRGIAVAGVSLPTLGIHSSAVDRVTHVLRFRA